MSLTSGDAQSLLDQYGSRTAAARAAGVSRRTFNRRLRAERSTPEPEGRVTGKSTLFDASGNMVLEWVKTREAEGQIAYDAIRESFAEYRGLVPLVAPPKHHLDDLATVYNIADHHLGLYAWAKETDDNYDLKIAEKLLLDSMDDLVSQAPASKVGLVLNLGDFFHTDNSSNRTLMSGNVLDVDTRFVKVLKSGVKLMHRCIELALQKHQQVIVRMVAGNHDPHVSAALSAAMEMAFAGNPRVFVDPDPGAFFYWRWGKVFLAATHGHMAKPEDMPGIMASRRPKDWGDSEFRYAYFGHVHHKSKGGGEKFGVVWETFQALTAKDAWHSASGYTSGRSMTAVTLDKNRGEVFRHTVSLRPAAVPALRDFPTAGTA